MGPQELAQWLLPLQRPRPLKRAPRRQESARAASCHRGRAPMTRPLGTERGLRQEASARFSLKWLRYKPLGVKAMR
eukprot:817284-Alexandrium_andersonii.AAC.1